MSFYFSSRDGSVTEVSADAFMDPRVVLPKITTCSSAMTLRMGLTCRLAITSCEHKI